MAFYDIGDGTARRALLKAVSIFSLERDEPAPTQILLKSFHVLNTVYVVLFFFPGTDFLCMGNVY